MKIPKRFSRAHFTDWEPDTPIRGLIETYLENFNEYYEKGMAPFLVGKAGTGKTHCAAALLNAITQGASEHLTSGWFTASETLNQMMDAKDLYMKEVYVRLKSNLKNSDIIVLDDISTLRNYQRLKETFWTVVDHRYAQMKPTILTANFDVQPGTDFWESLSETLSPAISRRIRECSEGLTLIF